MVRQVDDIEVDLIAEAIYQVYGYDFRHYAKASFKRRLRSLVQDLKLQSISHLQHELLHKPEVFADKLPQLTVTVSEMFRDPSFFTALRDQVIPTLRTYPTIKIWHAGCSTGEEVYSLAIILLEEGLLDRSVIYATDINPNVLKSARDGIYPISAIKDFTRNYQKSGGKEAFSDYYTTGYGGARFLPRLKERIVFSEHNLATDDVFVECQLIICRNVLIYFDLELQQRVVDLFARSLTYKGFLGLGSKESLRYVPAGRFFTDYVGNEKIYRNIRRHEFDYESL
jgi:chemotaxis protein methyltransferase CheR